MSTMFKLVAALVVTFAVASLVTNAKLQSADNAPPVRTHAADADLQGYYVPHWNPETGISTEYRAGHFKLNHISISTTGELTAYEKTGTTDIPTYAPVMLQFDDTSSPTGENELGQTYYEVTERVLPGSYTITATHFTFKGHSEKLGAITFDAKADSDKIKAARNNPAHISDGPALIGTLTIGDTVIEDVELMWYGGE